MRPLELPRRAPKPRRSALTMVVDAGVPTGYFEDVIASTGELIDFVKFGWGTALVTPDLRRKIACLRHHGVDYFFGGTLFERFVLEHALDRYRAFCSHHGCRHVEVSNGTIALGNREKAACIAELSGEFEVISEVGFKDGARSRELGPAEWTEWVAEDLEAGASLVLTEARESGRSGICTADGRPRHDIVEAILASGADLRRIVFEAPTKDLQAYFIGRVGPEVNLGNVAPGDAIALETLRMGLRSDTMLDLLEVAPHA
ncbi:MAG TPA: phosphosulfolactate synthase [Candidatus Dormibacteraeota bacterium]|nr:phosphosulfolactate synthase [Candidatus Dormibacteraeota bacterium]